MADTFFGRIEGAVLQHDLLLHIYTTGGLAVDVGVRPRQVPAKAVALVGHEKRIDAHVTQVELAKQTTLASSVDRRVRQLIERLLADALDINNDEVAIRVVVGEVAEGAQCALEQERSVVGNEAVVLASDEGLDANGLVDVGREERVLVLDLQHVGDVELEGPFDAVRAAVLSLVKLKRALVSEVRYNGVIEHHLRSGVKFLCDGGDDLGDFVV
mmetsp:Transcript_25462/g.47835  ORF Transcript_25462/g.47835 Transcript_25462/m.47835 type:complete len:214 (+) Transcript_25462:171-812(+)